MLNVLAVPVLAFLMGISGIPGLNALPGLKGLGRHKPKPVAADTLPPVWKPGPRLALERTFVRRGLPAFGMGPAGLKLNPQVDPRKVRTRVEPDSGQWSVAVEVGDIRLGNAYRQSLTQFAPTTMQQGFLQRWQERSRRDLNSLGAGNTPVARQGLQLALPVQLPSFATSILGPGGPALNVSGSESIRLSGQSNWTNQQTTVLGQRKSLFPSLDMQQDLDIRLEGQLSDRVKVNLLQNSANQIPLANRIAINYRGDEDDLVQALDLGNTSLALPGTQYVSYSGRNEGLFGVKVATRFGPLDFTALASKQEGRSERASYSGGSTRSTQTIADVDWIKGQYFLLYDPQYGAWNIDDADIRIYRDDRINSNDTNPLKGKAMVDPTGAMMQGVLGATPADTAGYRGNFDQLTPLVDYEILPDFYTFSNGFRYKIIRLKQPMPTNSNMCLAAAYRATPVNLATGTAIGAALLVGGERLGPSAGADSAYTTLKMLRSPRELLAPANAGDLTRTAFDTTAAFDRVRELEMKNFYALGGYGIDPKSFTLTVQLGRDVPPVQYTDGPGGTRVNFIEVLGLDKWDESNATPVEGHDEKVDGTGRSSGARAYVDYANGVLWIPDPRPFAPRVTAADPQFFDQLMDANANRRVNLTGEAGTTNAPNSGVYDKYSINPNQDARFYLVSDFAAQRSGGNINLQRGSLLEGSEVVTVNGERWTRDRDYRIDYDTGQITLIRGLGPTDQLSIDYSYAPLFQQAGKTLIGSAFRLEGRDRSLGGAFLYESKGAQDQRPRLGEEPSRTLITDLNSEWRFHPSFLTRAVDALPGVRTSAPSEFNLQAEVGASFPNPNTRNEVFVDDMEGVRDAVSLSLTADRWHPMSVPTRARVVDASGRAIVTDSFLDLPGQRNAELHWYMPPNYVHERDLKPTLTDAQGAKNPRQALALSVPQVPEAMRDDPGLRDSLWAGLTYVLDPQGVDLSRSQFLEIWVNDFRDRHDPAVPHDLVRANDKRVLLHVDLGVVSEDQMRAPNRLPDGVLNTEDRPPRDNQLTVTSDKDEDTGVDGVRRTAEQLPLADLLTASEGDPEGDNYRDPDNDKEDIDPRKFQYTNGTEDNYRLAPYPDTEDLNGNDNLDRAEHYFEYTIPLADSSQRYLMTDVHRDFSSRASVNDDNGWRRYRIPISDSLRVQFGSPDLTLARHVRVWVEGLEEAEPKTAAVQRPLLLLGGVEIVGSRWLAVELSDEQQGRQTTMTLNAVNSLDDADVYVPPFDPGETRNGNQALTRREQSISLEFTNLGPDTLEAYRSFSLEENYTRYGALRWYASSYEVSGYDAAADTSLFYFVRFASDERGLNYYEIKRRMPRSSVARAIDWQESRVVLEEISNFKLTQPSVITQPLRVPFGSAGDSVIIVGRPSFTRLRRISFGVINANPAGGRVYPSGRLWFDEVRATDVKKDVGYANRLLVNGRMANLLSYNVSWNSRDENFLSVGEARGTGSRSTQLQATTQFDTHRFFEGTGITLPVSVAYNRNSSKPRFSAGDDVVRTGEQQAASETRSESRSISTSYTRAWSERTHPLLKYTVAGLTANISRSETDSRTPSAVSSSSTTNAGVNWGVAPRQLLPIGMPLSKAKFYPLPERVYWNYQVSSSKSESFTRATDGSGDLVPSSNLKGRQATLGFGADTRPVDLITHHIEGQRALSLDNVPLDHIGFVNFGRLTSWRQNFTSRYALQRGPWLRPSLNWGSNFSQQNDITSPNLSVRAVNNGQNIQMNWDFPFDGLLNRRPAPAVTPAKPDSTGARTKPRGPALGWRDFVARVGNVQTDLQLSRSSSYSRLRGTPSFLYLVGLAEDPGFSDTSGVAAAPGNNSQTGLDWRTNARTRIPVVYGSQLMLRFSYGDRTGENNGVLSRTSDVRFPDVEVDYGRVAQAIKLTRFLQNPNIRTAWSVSRSHDYQVRRDSLTGELKSSDFHPLLALRGGFKNGIQADLGVNRRSTERLVHQFGTSSSVETNSDVNFTLSRSYSQGQKVTFLGKTSTVRSSVSMQLATIYSHTKGETRYANSVGSGQLRDETRLSVTGTGSYGFSSNVTGSAVLGFNHNNNRASGIVRRSVRVEVRAQFSF
ncbi:MAG: cell surface protein SprA [Candidatus Eisenbacteria bacterium]